MNRYTRTARGFTLIELTVVLLILVALAGIMVPLLTGYVERSHNGAAAANISEITKQIELYKVKTLKGYPDKWDSLMLSGNIWNAVPTAASTLLTAHPLTATESQALNDAGISTVFDGFTITSSTNATFDTPTASVTLAAGTKLAAVDTTQFFPTNSSGPNLAETIPNADPVNYTYVLLGLGNNCTAVGSVMTEAPVHFDTIDPAKFYQHYGAIFAVPGGTSGSTNGIVKLVAVVGIHDGGLSGLHDHLKEYMKTTAADQ